MIKYTYCFGVIYMKIKYELLKKDGKARNGILHTNYGSYKTPMFMPVGTLANVKTLVPEELKAMNSAVILSLITKNHHPFSRKNHYFPDRNQITTFSSPYK